MKEVHDLKKLHQICTDCLTALESSTDRKERFEAMETYELAKKAIRKIEDSSPLIFQPALA